MTFAATPEPPYYAVIFTTTMELDDEARRAYEATAHRMEALAVSQPGYLGIESARGGALGITVSYWESEAAIAAWRRHGEHTAARNSGRTDWYDAYELRVAKVERASSWRASRAGER